MPGLLPRALWRSAGDPPSPSSSSPSSLCLFRRGRPALGRASASATESRSPADFALLLTAVLAAAPAARGRGPRRRAALLVAAAALRRAHRSSPSLPNGADAIVSAGKLVELGVLTLAPPFLVDARAAAALLVGRRRLATLRGRRGRLVGFLPRDRRPAGARSWASTISPRSRRSPPAVGLARLHARRGNPAPLAIAGLVVGALGVDPRRRAREPARHLPRRRRRARRSPARAATSALGGGARHARRRRHHHRRHARDAAAAISASSSRGSAPPPETARRSTRRAGASG